MENASKVEMNRSNANNIQGFTLIEIISVITNLSIMGAIAIPKYTAIQQESEIKTLDVGLNDMKQREPLWPIQNQC